MASYVEALLREVAATRRQGAAPLETVFFGGGVRHWERGGVLVGLVVVGGSRYW